MFHVAGNPVEVILEYAVGRLEGFAQHKDAIVVCIESGHTSLLGRRILELDAHETIHADVDGESAQGCGAFAVGVGRAGDE